MDHFDARLRLREVTQELYDIGDEVAEYISNLAQSVADADRDLVDECVVELREIVDEAVDDARPLIGELAGLRQAFISGVKRGQLGSFSPRMPLAPPEAVTVAKLDSIPTPLQHPIAVSAVTEAMIARTEATALYLEQLADWVSQENIRGVEVLGAVKLPKLYQTAGQWALAAAAAWCVCVAEEHAAVARSLRGRRPPEFLMERARVAAVVARINQRRALSARAK